ncbi:hypothetical protein [Actinoplanes palleronii]|uniref:Uncharacterized protein n=1 Tax=Actinoplanes palleronii TaxID=113570 RepID=A0ABQ4B7Y0_9ACTN|nr:hypothetical protein [Actinoplanes palleronii]GIE66720.1 hypothetical protein Apa02nite_028280 [Actinoplanes palleronii]
MLSYLLTFAGLVAVLAVAVGFRRRRNSGMTGYRTSAETGDNATTDLYRGGSAGDNGAGGF